MANTDNDDTKCMYMYYEIPYLQSTVDWLRCKRCELWVAQIVGMWRESRH